MTLSISVVIRCFNEEEHIGRLLSGLLMQSVQPERIIVVDSGSTDATLAIAARFPVEIHHIAPDVFSFGRSLNVGCRAATGELIAIASAHVYPLSGGVLLRNLFAIPWFRTAQFRGTYKGFAQRGDVSVVLRRRSYYPLELRHPRMPIRETSDAGQPIHYDDMPSQRRAETHR